MPGGLSAVSIGELYPRLLELLLGSPESAPRGQRTREQLGLQLFIADLTQNILVHPVRDLNYRFMVAEFLWIMAGRDDVESLARYNQEMRRFSDNGQTLAGAYGPRLRGREMYGIRLDQLAWCVNKLKEDPDSRQAVATIWQPCPPPDPDIPCTVAAQFLLRDGGLKDCTCVGLGDGGFLYSDDSCPTCKGSGHVAEKMLHAIFTMRSSDAWLGLPYDVFTFSMIANCLAGELKCKPGSLTMQLGSSHLYEEHWAKEHWAKATELVSRWQESSTVVSPVLQEMPDCSFFSELLRGQNASMPWDHYRKVLQAGSKSKALEVLLNAAPQP